MRTPHATHPAPPPETHNTANEDASTSITHAPRYWPASEQRVAARFAPFVIQGSSGSQARAILAQALINARRRGFEVIAISRDSGAFTRQPVHHVDNRGHTLRTLSLSPQAHPTLRVWPASASAQIPNHAQVFNSVVAHAVVHSVKDLPTGTKIFTGQNGVPNALPPAKKLQRQHFVSMIASTIKDSPKCATVTVGGALYFDERTPDRDYLERVLGGGDLFALKFVPDIRVHQWRKIASNVVNNTLCTLFDTHFGGLLDRAEKDPRCLALVRGMLAETIQVARRHGIDPGALDELHSGLIDTQRTWPAHRSSMRHALVSGHTTENAYLAGAIAHDSQRLGLPAPLCTRAAQSLDRYVEMRDRAGPDQAPQFYARNQDWVATETEALLDLAGHDAASRNPPTPSLP